MQISMQNFTYFKFRFTEFEMRDKNTREFMTDLKSRISGTRRGRGTMRFYLAEEKAWCIHRARWNMFAILVKKYFGYVPECPFKQMELL